MSTHSIATSCMYEPDHATTTTTAAIVSSRKPVIMLVEDSSFQAEFTRYQLEQVGYRVEVVANPTQALSVLTHSRPALVVMGLYNSLPSLSTCTTPSSEVASMEWSGLELCRQIKQHPLHAVRAVPLIVLSTQSRLSDLTSSFRAGADYYIVKGSANHRQLPQLIRTILSRDLSANQIGKGRWVS